MTDTENDNDNIINDIQHLQNTEKELFNSLDNSHLDTETTQKIINKINVISQMRINLYKLLNKLNNKYNNNLTNTREVLSQQTTAIDIVENELNRSKVQLALIEEEKNNKIRLIEINNYYGQSYEEHTQLMKLIVFILIPIIVLSLLLKYNYIPVYIYSISIAIIIFIGIILLWRNYSKIYMHDKINYPEYDWSFDTSKAPKPEINVSSDAKDPWTSYTRTCIGQDCCTENTIYDSTLNKCKPVINLESFINNTFTKHTKEFKKPDIIMNSIIYPKNY